MKIHQEKQRPKFKVWLILLFVFLSMGACFYMYMKSSVDIKDILAYDNSDKNAVSESMADNTANDKSDNSGGTKIINPVPEGTKRGMAYFDKAAFVGDSQMKGLADYKLFPTENMLLGDSLKISGIYGENDAVKPFFDGKSYDAAYFMLGMNDLDGVNDKTLFDGAEKLLADLKKNNPDIKIYLVSLLPVTADNENGGVSNNKINSFNSALLDFANEYGIYYLDLNTGFVGNDGRLPDKFTVSSGYRLTEEAYGEISNNLLSHTV